jgi:ABC-type uncharacterized transport system, periplasmic component
MKKIAAVLLTAALVCGVAFANGQSEQAAKPASSSYKIGVSKLLSHPALDATEQGMMDYLATTDLNVTYDLQNAQADISTSSTIAQKFKSDKDDVVVGIATPTAQALANIFTDTPVVFSAVTDAVEAGLVTTDQGDPSSNVCGVSDKNPVESQIKLLVELTGAKTIGNVYSSGEANGVVLMEQAKAACEKLGVGFVEVAISNSAEVKMATQSIIDRVDAMYIATDNAVISALASIADVASKANKPLFSSDPSGVDGIDFLVAWGFNYYSIGTATGKMVEKILKGENAGSLGVTYLTEAKDFELWFNLDNAKKLGITLPQSYLDNAAYIIENGQKIAK